MKGLLVEKAGAAYALVDNLTRPKPSPSQMLVKSLATSINPVDTYMQTTGLLVTAWPVVLGCDSAGVVVEVGSEAASRFKVGDEVCGCTRLGFPGHGTFQEFFLMDAHLTMAKPKNLSLLQAATLGVASETAALGLFLGLQLPLLDPARLPAPRDEWLLVLGALGNVGQNAVQLAKLCGFKVLASCSAAKAEAVRQVGADAVFDYKTSEEEQRKVIQTVTGGRFFGIFDTSASSHDFALKTLAELSTEPKKHFTTTNDWSAPKTYPGVEVCRIALGDIGRSGSHAGADTVKINKALETFMPLIPALCEAGKLRPTPATLVGQVGFASVLEAIERQQKQGGKYVVKLQSA